MDQERAEASDMGRGQPLGIPDHARAAAARWKLHGLEPLARGAESLVVRAEDGEGTPWALKCRPPGDPGTEREAAALRLLACERLVALKAVDAEAGVLWLEWVLPGHALAAETDAAARDAFCQVAAALACAHPSGAPEGFPRLADQLAALDSWQNACSAAESRAVAEVVAGAWRLAASPHPVVLLHGDLHGGNLLHRLQSSRAGDGAMAATAIDPKGVWGDPAYEPACFLMNRWTRRPWAVSAMQRYARGLSARLGLDEGRVWAWAGVHTALSLAWSREDHAAMPAPSDPRWRVLQDWMRGAEA